MSFNRRDLEDDDFNFDDGDDFDFDDNGDDFKFDDEPADIALDDDVGEFGFEDEDMPDIDEDGDGDGGGVSRTFIIIAGVMILLFVLGLAAVLLIATQNSGPTPIELTATQITILNSTTEAEVALRGTQSAFDAATQTAIALLPTETPTPSPSPSPTATVAEPTLDATAEFNSILQTQQAFQATQVFLLTQVATSVQGFQSEQVAQLTQVAAVSTAVQDAVEAQAATQVAMLVIPLVPTLPPSFPTELAPGQDVQLTQVATLISQLDPTTIAQANMTQIAQLPPTQEVQVIGPDAVAQTATALAILLAPPDGQGGGEIPTQEFFPTVTIPGVPVPTALPDTGFFEDLAAGNANVGMMVLLGFGLVGVILLSRWLRTLNNKPQ
jgi:hypothetical protein